MQWPLQNKQNHKLQPFADSKATFLDAFQAPRVCPGWSQGPLSALRLLLNGPLDADLCRCALSIRQSDRWKWE